jgi:hypothetical protein
MQLHSALLTRSEVWHNICNIFVVQLSFICITQGFIHYNVMVVGAFLSGTHPPLTLVTPLPQPNPPFDLVTPPKLRPPTSGSDSTIYAGHVTLMGTD